MIQHTKITYSNGNEDFKGYIAQPAELGSYPAVLICHDWGGCGDFTALKAKELAELGYIGFAIDMYGNGQTGSTNEEKSALMMPLINNRLLLLERIQTAFHYIEKHPQVDTKRIAIMGFCFGGLCALDLARSGANLRGAISLHGNLTPSNLPAQAIKAKILALHGYKDPLVSKEAVDNFEKEMSLQHVDWQLHIYGKALHAFTNPNANDPSFGTVFDKVTANRAELCVRNFLNEIFAN